MKDKKLSDYIKNVLQEEGLTPVEKKKLTFDEWVKLNKDTPDHSVTYFNLYNIGCGDMDQESYFFFSLIWKAAQENV